MREDAPAMWTGKLSAKRRSSLVEHLKRRVFLIIWNGMPAVPSVERTWLHLELRVYDEKPNDPNMKPLSQRDKDERDQATNAAAKQRLKNWSIYRDFCNSFRDGNVKAILLLTCKVGGATGFLQRLCMHMMMPIIAYKDQVMADPNRPNGRVRVLPVGDKNRENQGTNTAWGEIFFPLSMTQMVQISPIQHQEWF